jgi:hypothetical protein
MSIFKALTSVALALLLFSGSSIAECDGFDQVAYGGFSARETYRSAMPRTSMTLPRLLLVSLNHLKESVKSVRLALWRAELARYRIASSSARMEWTIRPVVLPALI